MAPMWLRWGLTQKKVLNSDETITQNSSLSGRKRWYPRPWFNDNTTFPGLGIPIIKMRLLLLMNFYIGKTASLKQSPGGIICLCLQPGMAEWPKASFWMICSVVCHSLSLNHDWVHLRGSDTLANSFTKFTFWFSEYISIWDLLH